MDAKSKADFINSVASGDSIPCPKCGRENKSGCKFCVACGTPLSAPQSPQTDAAPAFEQVVQSEPPVQNELPVQSGSPVQAAVYEEQKPAFADGLPDWSIEPPQIMVRRR